MPKEMPDFSKYGDAPDFSKFGDAPVKSNRPLIDTATLRKYAAMGVRGLGGLAPGGPIGGLIGGITEGGAEALEGRFDIPEILLQAGMGAIPFGKQASLLKSFGKGAMLAGGN